MYVIVSMKLQDAELIALIGTQVEDGYLVRNKDFQQIKSDLTKFLKRLRRIVGKRLILNNGQVVTAYHASRKHEGGFYAAQANLIYTGKW